MKYDCIVIGAGMSGIAAAIRLAHYEKKVCVCERHFRVGGLNSYYSRDGIELESGLHAMTNFASSRANSLPLPKLLRQLRIPYDAISPREQNHSIINFPESTIRFSNNFDDLKDSINTRFPDHIDNFLQLDKKIMEWDEVNLNNSFISARSVVNEYIKSSLLTEMLFCPLMYYGSANEHDMDFSQFVIMYKSIFKEGFFRPANGIHGLLDVLVNRMNEAGAELRLNCQIDKIITKDGRAIGVMTDKGEIIEANNILSSAGVVETAALYEDAKSVSLNHESGKLTFIETIALPDNNVKMPESTIIFFNSSHNFNYSNPSSNMSLESGVICFPANFNLRPGDNIPLRFMRTTVLANNRLWFDYDASQYSVNKKIAVDAIIKKSLNITGIPENSSIQIIDAFTPRTINRFTARINGAIYGSPVKHKTGITNVNNVFICGTDQGFLGITGALLSGISIANLHLLR